jgi:FkbM family methyltransferase
MLKQYNIDTVIDVGSNIGQFVSLLNSGHFKGQIISIEPDLKSFSFLEKNFKNQKNLVKLNLGLDVISGVRELHISPDGGLSNSFLEISNKAETDHYFVGKEKVVTTTLKDIFTGYNLYNKRIFLKLDIQGYEGRILQDIDVSLFPIYGLRIEASNVEIYRDVWKMSRILDWLETNGFYCLQFIEGDSEKYRPKWFDIVAYRD